MAIAVATDEQWPALRGALGDPAWAADPALATARRPGAARTTAIDEHLQAWCGDRTADDIVELPLGRRRARRPRSCSRTSSRTSRSSQHRGFFEDVDHPVTGTSRYSTLPMRFSRGPERFHPRHAPLLGEHNGRAPRRARPLAGAEIDALEAAGIIGDTLAQQA